MKPKSKPKRPVRTTHKVKAFLAAYRVTANVVRAARAAGIDRKQHYRHLKHDPAYAEAFEDARREATTVLEDEAVRRALEGTREPVYYKGKVCGHITRYSDTLLTLLLRSWDPRYRDKTEISVSIDEITKRLDAGRRRVSELAPPVLEIEAAPEESDGSGG